MVQWWLIKRCGTVLETTPMGFLNNLSKLPACDFHFFLLYAGDFIIICVFLIISS